MPKPVVQDGTGRVGETAETLEQQKGCKMGVTVVAGAKMFPYSVSISNLSGYVRLRVKS